MENSKLCIVCEHIAINPSRKAWIQRDAPVLPNDSGITILCDDGEEPCSRKGHSIKSIALLTSCVSHYQTILESV